MLESPIADLLTQVTTRDDTPRVADLRRRVRNAMELPPDEWTCPPRIDEAFMSEPLPVRKARALALKLSAMPSDLWEGQLFAGSMTLEHPRTHYERGFPDYVTDEERQRAAERGLTISSVFGHIVPDYPRLLRLGLVGILAEMEAQRAEVQSPDEAAFLDSVEIALKAVIDYAVRLAERCADEAEACLDPQRADELARMAVNLRQAPAGPAQTY